MDDAQSSNHQLIDVTRVPAVLSSLGHYLNILQEPFRDAVHLRSRATHTFHLIWQTKFYLEVLQLPPQDPVIDPFVIEAVITPDQMASRFILHSLMGVFDQLESAVHGMYEMLLDVEEGFTGAGDPIEVIEEIDCVIIYDGRGEKLIKRTHGGEDGLRGRLCDINMTIQIPDHLMDLHMSLMAFLLGFFQNCLRVKMHASLDHKTKTISINIPVRLGGRVNEEEKEVIDSCSVSNEHEVFPQPLV